MRKFVLAIAIAAALSGVALGPAAALPNGLGCTSPFMCGNGNGTKLTGIALPSVASRQPVVTAVKLPSGETVHLH